MVRRQSRMSEKEDESDDEFDDEFDDETISNRKVSMKVAPITPLHGRSCTDIICLLLFIAFLVGWGCISVYAFTEGNLHQALMPTDSNGSRCGIDRPVQHRPKLLFFDIAKCVNPLTPVTGCQTPHICVRECPHESFFLFLSRNLSMQELREKMICVNDFDKQKINSYETAELLTIGEDAKCAKYYIQSTEIENRCIPIITLSLIDDVLKKLKEMDEHDPSMTNANELEQTLSKTNVGVMIAGDIQKSYKEILFGLLISMLVCFIFIFILRWLAGPVIWLSIVGAIISLGFTTYYSYYKYSTLNNQIKMKESGISLNLRAILTKSLESEQIWFWLMIISGVVLLIVLLITAFLRKRIGVAVAIIREGSKAISSIKTAVFFPLVPLVFKILVIIFGIVVALQLESIGTKGFKVAGLDENCRCIEAASNYTNYGTCSPKIFYRKCKTGDGLPCPNATCNFMNFNIPDLMFYFKTYNIIGFLWVFFFINAFGEMVLGATFSIWYWKFNKSEVPYFTVITGMGRTIRYHLGTIAFGSLIITICQILQLLLEYVDQQLKKYDNGFTRAILCIFKCLFWCFQKFIKIINRNAYIMCAIHGRNFCRSARDACNLILRNVLHALAVDNVTGFLFFLSKIFLSIGMGYLTYQYFSLTETSIENLKDDEVSKLLGTRVQFKEVPMILVGLGTYIIASLFFKVYSMAIDTLFLCFLEDCEFNDGSPEKPYFMSKKLMQILSTKNKEDEENISKNHLT